MAAEVDILALRAMREGDLPFIVSTWARSLPVPHWMAVAEFRTNMRRAVQLTLKRAGAHVLVSGDHDATILGWACGESGAVHHAYFRPEMRASAVGRDWIARTIRTAKGE